MDRLPASHQTDHYQTEDQVYPRDILKYQDRRIQPGFCLYQGKYKLLHPETSLLPLW